jgi:squalene-hopene/tetraprenyl-beta-curcumene cyclase
VLQGLAAIDFPMDHPRIHRAVAWLEATQQPGGAWGETCRSYDDPSLKGTGDPTPSQTAWATLGLIAAGRSRSVAVHRGIDYLVREQNPDGSWDEPTFTGTGFPRVFYLRYHYYRIYFPLMALARYRAAIGRESGTSTPALASRIPAQPVSQDT